MQHLKNVVITKPFHQNMHYPCPHRTEKQKRIIYGVEPGPDVPNSVDRLSLSLISFLQHLKDDQLRSFRDVPALRCRPIVRPVRIHRSQAVKYRIPVPNHGKSLQLEEGMGNYTGTPQPQEAAASIMEGTASNRVHGGPPKPPRMQCGPYEILRN
ncbi:MAG: hypothetical protein Q9175_008337 [Cornicularia normoerica]